MGAGDAARGTHDSNLLTSLHRIAHGDGRLRQMEVAGHHSVPVIDVDHVPGEEEVVHERDDAPIRGDDGIAGLTGEVHAAVAARQTTVEEPSRSKAARYAGAPRPFEWLRPKLRSMVRPSADRACLLVLPLDPRLRQRVWPRRVNLRHAQPASACGVPASGIHPMRHRHQGAQRIELTGRMVNNHPRDDAV